MRENNQKHRPNGAAAEGGACVSDLFISWILMDIPYIFLIYCIFPKYVPYISLVCFLIYGVKSRSGHDASQSFGQIWHVLDPEMVFWRNL